MYKIFDIYNNGFHWGGKLRKLFDRYMIIDQNERVRLTHSNIYPKT